MQNYQIKQLFYGHTQQESEIEALRKQLSETTDELKETTKKRKKNITTTN